MAIAIEMPKMGATMEEGTLVTWLVQIGETVEEGDPIAEIQTDKIVIEIEAEQTGVLLKTLYEPGQVILVHEIIAYMGAAGEEIKEQETAEPPESEVQIKSLSKIENLTLEQPINAKVRRTPAARALANKHQIDLHDIVGTGPKFRIQKTDVENYLMRQQIKITPLAKKIAQAEGIDTKAISGTGTNGKITKVDIITPVIAIQKDKEEHRVPFTGIRKVIAKHISDTFYTAPHVTLHSEIDMTDCVSLRQHVLPVIEKVNGYRVSFNDILIKAVGHTLTKHPNINISLDKDEIVYHSHINIGMAVAVDAGLIVPVLRNVNELSLTNITSEAKTIVQQARIGSLLPDQLKGSTFTISNLGMYAVDGFTPIINSPNAAILGVGRIQKKAVVIDDEIKIRSMMTISLSFDHRIIDGAPAAAFLTDFKDSLENPYTILV
jgi:pyruvate dehydrogenase E2 component (dihydrolipoamide acetyltransferase)